MCLIFISINNHPKYKLVIAANRDEFYARKTAAVSYWEDHPEVVGGRDLEANGTWMAMTRSGRIGMVTNYRDPKNINPNAPTRGHLVSDYLLNGNDSEEYLKALHLNASKYNGFSLVIGKIDDLMYYSNYQSKIIKLAPGFYGLSNHLLDTPWPKVKKGKKRFQTILAKEAIDSADIFELLRDEGTASDNELPNTGLDLERERALSAVFIKTPNYGSRCSTVVLVDKKNKVTYSERVYDLKNFDFEQKDFQFEIS